MGNAAAVAFKNGRVKIEAPVRLSHAESWREGVVIHCKGYGLHPREPDAGCTRAGDFIGMQQERGGLVRLSCVGPRRLAPLRLNPAILALIFFWMPPRNARQAQPTTTAQRAARRAARAASQATSDNGSHAGDGVGENQVNGDAQEQDQVNGPAQGQDQGNGPAQGQGQAAMDAAAVEELRRYREAYGGRLPQEGAAGGASLQLSHHKPTKRSPARHESCRRHQHAEEAPPSTTVRAAQVADRGCQAAGFSILWSVTACTSESQIRNRICYLAVLDPDRQPIKLNEIQTTEGLVGSMGNAAAVAFKNGRVKIEAPVRLSHAESWREGVVIHCKGYGLHPREPDAGCTRAGDFIGMQQERGGLVRLSCVGPRRLGWLIVNC
ncbi:hypothetical protein IGI04_015902 [Brassica rapa subsp. trilocularis]|uniref:Uncharacterized protein n=1 Tax=Brassica rapa subsp. trilocularis TaxID=1813537 RepID=A0ABQ7MRE6_BRACM|nr:hypothetical protein IGI04_015902 [Brassica rapa subsp. trilocularis]